METLDSLTFPQKLVAVSSAAALAGIVAIPFVSNCVAAARKGKEDATETTAAATAEPAPRGPDAIVWKPVTNFFFGALGLATIPIWAPPALFYEVSKAVYATKAAPAAAAAAAAPEPATTTTSS
jgi:hypothetical protein